jgi:hypothetical protein
MEDFDNRHPYDVSCYFSTSYLVSTEIGTFLCLYRYLYICIVYSLLLLFIYLDSRTKSHVTFSYH